MKKTPKPTGYIVMMIATLVLGGGGMFYLWGEVSGRAGEVAQMRSSVRSGDDLQKEVWESSAKLVDSEAKLNHLEKGVPDFAYIPTMLKELETTGKLQGIDVFGVRPITIAEPPKKSDGTKPQRKAYDELAIEVKGRGSYRSVLNFVDALKTFPKIVAARTVSLQPIRTGKPDDVKGQLDVTIELRAYVFAVKEDTKPKAKAEGSSN
ncbi:MAG: type 4a pilus biogenesis protein PilO [Fimbriimonadaceae bacterium]|nr:type 4a pilus biogenesis protein PilO [Fimbriimonadaceae bacterium]